MTLGVQPQERFSDGRDLSRVVAGNLSAQEERRAPIQGDRAKEPLQGIFDGWREAAGRVQPRRPSRQQDLLDA
eukprot:11594309-Alexandrium_andersonii.AAC.1